MFLSSPLNSQTSVSLSTHVYKLVSLNCFLGGEGRGGGEICEELASS